MPMLLPSVNSLHVWTPTCLASVNILRPLTLELSLFLLGLFLYLTYVQISVHTSIGIRVSRLRWLTLDLCSPLV